MFFFNIGSNIRTLGGGTLAGTLLAKLPMVRPFFAFIFIISVISASLPSLAQERGVHSSKERHKIVLLNKNLGSLYARLALIEAATQTIDIEYYILEPSDRSTRILLQAIYRKAKEGVKVRILVDAAPVIELISDHLAEVLSQVGVEVRYYNEQFILNLKKVNHRNHRKLIAVDDRFFLTGGRNLSDKYFDLNKRMNYLDRDVVVDGPLAISARESFEEFWSSPKSKGHERVVLPVPQDYGYKSEKEMRMARFNSEMDKANYRAYRSAIFSYQKGKEEAEAILIETEEDRKLLAIVRDFGRDQFVSEYQGSCDDTELVTDFPEIKKTSMSVDESINQKIAEASESVLIESPYFIVQQKNPLFDHLRTKGRKVVVLTNSLYSTDNILTIASFYNRVNDLIDMGIGFYLFSGKNPEGYHAPLSQYTTSVRWGIHSKSFVIDDSEAVVGTYNVDPRSKNINSEMAVICSGNKELATRLKEDILLRAVSSPLLHPDTPNENYKSRYIESSGLKILLHYLVSPFASIIEDSL